MLIINKTTYPESQLVVTRDGDIDMDHVQALEASFKLLAVKYAVKYSFITVGQGIKASAKGLLFVYESMLVEFNKAT